MSSLPLAVVHVKGILGFGLRFGTHFVCSMALNFKIKLFSIGDESARPELLSPFFCQVGDTYAELRLRLEKGGCVEWPFQFWDFDDQCRIRKTFEAMNPVSERVYVIPEPPVSGSRDLGATCFPHVGETGSNDFVAPSEVEFDSVDVDDLETNVYPSLEVDGVAVGFNPEVIEDVANLLESKLIPDDIMANYKRGAEKLRRDLADLDFADHLWQLKSYDLNGVAVVKILCGEYNKESGGTSGEHNRSIIQNLFAGTVLQTPIRLASHRD